jgi:hypothetical protein
VKVGLYLPCLYPYPKWLQTRSTIITLANKGWRRGGWTNHRHGLGTHGAERTLQRRCLVRARPLTVCRLIRHAVWGAIKSSGPVYGFAFTPSWGSAGASSGTVKFTIAPSMQVDSEALHAPYRPEIQAPDPIDTDRQRRALSKQVAIAMFFSHAALYFIRWQWMEQARCVYSTRERIKWKPR